jgi:4-amino-4-deoxy-L-arabinose transferase-like glycosyltransferase
MKNESRKFVKRRDAICRWSADLRHDTTRLELNISLFGWPVVKRKLQWAGSETGAPSAARLNCNHARQRPYFQQFNLMTKLQAQDQSEQPWLWAGYLLTAALLLFRLGYIASGTIELSNDEAYQWLWSKHLALSYFSKPPGIAFIQFAGTALWGDTQFGVRFFSPVFAAILSVVVLRFMAREAGARQGFLLLLIITSAPLMSLGTILMTVDPPLVLCCTLAMIAGWRAVQPDGTTIQWLLAGLAAGLGFLSKYSAAYLLVCWALFFLLWPLARAQLKKSGPYLALLVFALCTLPVIIWNAQNGWITVHHVADNAGVTSAWHPTLLYFGEFLALEALLLNPVFFGNNGRRASWSFISSAWAGWFFWDIWPGRSTRASCPTGPRRRWCRCTV